MCVAQRLQSSVRLVNSWPENRLNDQELFDLFNCSLPLTRLVARFNPKVRLTSEDVLSKRHGPTLGWHSAPARPLPDERRLCKYTVGLMHEQLHRLIEECLSRVHD